MIKRLEGKKVVGYKQGLKALSEDNVAEVYIAEDADIHITEPITNLADKMNISIYKVCTKDELGSLCGIDIGAAVACILKK
ncbi:ribosomal L7Ae/L30e/S12e/Gadd45 family protein [Clostridium sp. DL1XJH146]